MRIELICAYSSQAKWLADRALRTLQDRLIKEMRLKGISNIANAKAYLAEFIERYNKRFAVDAAHPKDSHLAVIHDECRLRRVLAYRVTRKLSKTLEFSLKDEPYQVQVSEKGYRYQNKKVMIYESYTGDMVLGDETLNVVALDKITRGSVLADRKDLDTVFAQRIYPKLITPAIVTNESTAHAQLSY